MAGFFEAATHFDVDPTSLRAIIDNGASLSRTDRDGMTLLHYACREGHLAAVQMLVNEGAPLEAQDREGRTPLHLACLMTDKRMSRASAHVPIASFLLSQGAQTGTQDKYGYMPLAYQPFHAKRVGLNTQAVDGTTSMWSVEVVEKGDPVLVGSVAQSSAIQQR